MKRSLFLAFLLSTFALGLANAPARADINDAYDKATHAAITKVAPCVVQIVTQGGTDLVVTGPKGPAFRKALGPTTGLIVSKDGYVISSAFNFINNPSSILVEVPGRKKKFIAKKVATDTSKMLTLLKIDAKDLPVAPIVPKKELAVGQLALALGRTLDKNQDNPPSVSIGIISALGRVWGKCIQTDANTSPVNYGGPLIDIRGRVQGIVVPASPRGTGETAGFEWYDSGIGFAIPMEDVMAVLPRLKKGKDLQKGLLGVRMKSADIYSTQPVIAAVVPNTAAARAGLKAGDAIVEMEGKPVVRMAQMLHILGTHYEGDRISLKYRRSGKVVAVKGLELVGTLKADANGYLGILPMRDDPKRGVEIRYVYPGSPADKAGLKAGDRIVKYGTMKITRPFQGKIHSRDELKRFLNQMPPGTDIKLEVKRKGGKTESVTAALDSFPGSKLEDKDAPPKMLPKVASLKKALVPLGGGKKKKGGKQPDKKNEVETGLLKKTTSSGNQTYWVYVHDDYDPNISHALLVWLHPPGKNKEKDIDVMATTWDAYCRRNHILFVAPTTDSVNGWTPSDGRHVQEAIHDVLEKYSIDEQRIVVHGLGVGGQMAIYMGFSARDLVRGVATTGSVATGIKDNIPNRPLQFFIVAGDRDPLAKAIAKSQAQLTKHKLPVIYREIQGLGRQYLDVATMAELVRWIDSLDRM